MMYYNTRALISLIVTFLCVFVIYVQPINTTQFFVPRNENITERYRYDVKKFTVPVDHFSFALNHTFELRYLVNNEFQSGKNPPIFFYTGNEGNIKMFAENSGFIWDIAPDFGALLIFAEHRYYGESMPYGNKSFANPEYLGYLTAQQAMADYIDLIVFLKSNAKLKHSPVIAFGGSYGGMLSAWIRMKYPHMIQGAIAASAPVLYFTGIVDCRAYSRIATSDFRSVNPVCPLLVRKSWQAISNISTTDEGKKWLSTEWNLCKPLKNSTDVKSSKNSTDVKSLKDWLSDAYSTLAMLDYPYETNFLRPLAANPISVFCEHLTNPSLDGKNLLVAMNKAIKTYANYTGQISCLSTDDIGPNLGADGWSYQSCTEMVMPMCSDGVNDMFEPTEWDFRKFSDDCYKKYHVRPQKDLACKSYGCKDLSAATNIVFSNGLRDPWSSGGVLKKVSSSAIAAIIPEGAHHLDLRGANPKDPYTVVQVRKLHASSIREWIKEYRQNVRNKSGIFQYIDLSLSLI